LWHWPLSSWQLAGFFPALVEVPGQFAELPQTKTPPELDATIRLNYDII
jgi:hypothetical protein